MLPALDGAAWSKNLLSQARMSPSELREVPLPRAVVLGTDSKPSAAGASFLPLLLLSILVGYGGAISPLLCFFFARASDFEGWLALGETQLSRLLQGGIL